MEKLLTLQKTIFQKAAKSLTTSPCRNASAKIPSEPFQLYQLDEPPSKTVDLDTETALKIYRELQAIRRMETVIADLYQTRTIRGFCHLYSGQEAGATAIFNTRRDQDTLITSYRCHAFLYFFSKYNLHSVFSELMGFKDGCSHGKGGSMHLYAPKFYGGNGIVGSQVPLGVGLGLMHQYLNTKGVSFTLYGDGAANQGQVAEVFNISKLWMLPVIFICENNLYGMGTSAERSSADDQYYKRCEFIPGIQVNGMDLISCMAASNYAIDWCMAGKGPIILEFKMYRYYGHSMSDPGTSYRKRDEITQVRQTKDPLLLFTKKILEAKLTTEAELKKIEKEEKQTVNKVVEIAKKGSEIELEHLTYNTYKKNLEPIIRNVNHFQHLLHKNLEPPK